MFALEEAYLQEEDGVSYEDYRGPQIFEEPLIPRARSVYGGHMRYQRRLGTGVPMKDSRTI